MLTKQDKKLLAEITPIINRLAKEWFPSDRKSPEGFFYACNYCDQNCSRHDNHDKDCFLRAAKETQDEWIKIDQRSDLDGNPINKKKRSPEEIREFKDWFKVRYLITNFFPALLSNITPFDHSEHERGVVCECSIFEENTSKHTPDCPRQNLAQILSDFYNTKN